ncbi:MAG TPA: riboflavin synthase [Actinomycetales bacterium]|nr:riboflavin synthase [Actinomycetales bacterium]
MFTGIITDIGTVTDVRHTEDAALITLTASSALEGIAYGDSISVDGVCLTVTEFTAEDFTADVMAETLRVTTIGNLKAGDRVNLERAMPASGRFDGHIGQGHVDGTAEVTAIKPGERWSEYSFTIPTAVGRYLVPKGSVAINGTSLTLTQVKDAGDATTSFGVSLIPTTLSETTLGALEVGHKVNIEVDVIAKYVERLVK